MSTSFKHNGLYFLASTLAFFLVWMITPHRTLQPTGIVLPIQTLTRSAIPESDVKVEALSPEMEQFNQQPIAFVNVEQHTTPQSNEQRQSTINYARHLAASIGAKRLVYSISKNVGAGMPEALGMYIFRGYAF